MRLKGLRSSLKRRLRHWKQLLGTWHYDFARFRHHACPTRNPVNREQHRAYLTMLTHAIEKGLALAGEGESFGAERARLLLREGDAYRTRYGDDEHVRSAGSALRAYCERFDEHPDRDKELLISIRARLDQEPPLPEPLIGLTADPVVTAEDFEAFTRSRASVRRFGTAAASPESIARAARAAQRAPSACNRQPGRIHMLPRSERTERILALQGGNRGFGPGAGHVAILTTELSTALSVDERNQPWIDGGLFAMGFILGLHAEGLAICALNWAASPDKDRALRDLLPIPNSESVVMLLAIGSYPEDQVRVPRSERRKLDETLSFHGHDAS